METACADPQRACADPQRACANPQRACADPQRACAEPFNVCRQCSSNVFDKWLKLPPAYTRPLKRDPKQFVQRTEEEAAEMIKKWMEFVHPRARDFWPTEAAMNEVLRTIAMSTDKRDDLVLAGDNYCVFWYGEVTADTEPLQAAISMQRPDSDNPNEKSSTYVNRLLAFLFATDTAFQELMRLPKEPFRMICRDQLCVNLNHLAVEATDARAR